MKSRAPHNPYRKGVGDAYLWIEKHVSYTGDDCLPWPFAKDGRVGRGRLGWDGKMYWAHRLMCEMAHGPAPSMKHQAAHLCGKGHKGCVNPRHLAWKTNKENSLDKIVHGTTNDAWWGRKGKLTPSQLGLLKSRKGMQTQLATAKEFGVSLSLVQYHWHGKDRWPSHSGKTMRLNQQSDSKEKQNGPLDK